MDNNGEDLYIWTHKKFEIGHSADGQIVDVNLTSEARVKLEPGLEKIAFTYEIIWKSSDVKFEDRFDKYLDPNFFQHRVSWEKEPAKDSRLAYLTRTMKEGGLVLQV